MGLFGGRRPSGAGVGMRGFAFFDTREISDAVERGRISYLTKGGGYTRRVARSSIKRQGMARPAPKRKYSNGGELTAAWRRWRQESIERPASAPGSAPFSHDGTLRNSIFYGLERGRTQAVIGSAFSEVGGELAELHEFGGRRSGDRYPARPFMGPALEKVAPKLPEFWANAIRKR